MHKRTNELSQNEVNQSIVRSVNTLAILVYLSLYSYIDTGKILVSYTIPAVIYLSATIPLYFWSLRCTSLSDYSVEKITYRITGLAGDIISLSIVMIYANNAGIPLFFVYLWIIVGNGIRYGVNYLVVSTVISIACFMGVIYSTPVWQSNQLFLIAMGLLISMIVLPFYILKLIARLSMALESEKTANQVKQSFLANINHELRTPLNSIISLGDLIRRQRLVTEVDRMVEMISVSANAQLKIINSILDFSKIEAGEYKLENSSFNLYSLIHEVHQIIMPLAVNKKLEFYVHIDVNCAHGVVGAYDQIKQILINLAGNAVKFTETGFVKLSVYVNSQSEKCQCLIFEVEDTGIGISVESQKTIFKPFTQADSSITRKYGGTGLGIAISDELAKLMGGSITLRSELNRGTTFALKLELNKDNITELDKMDDIHLLPLKLSRKHNKVLTIYKDQGFKLLPVDRLNSSEFDKTIYDKRIVILVDSKDLNTFQGLHIKSVDVANTPIVIINTENDDNATIHNAVTSIHVDSQPEQLINAVKIASEFINNSKSPVIPHPEITPSLNILIAEDDPTLRQINKILFGKMHHKVDYVSDGISALNALINRSYDVAVLDMHMPGLSGVDVALQFNSINQNANTALILLTADIYNVNSGGNALSVFSDILLKPVTPSKLLYTIANCIKLSDKLIGNDLSVAPRVDPQVDMNHKNISLLDNIIVNKNIEIAGLQKLHELLNDYDNEVKINLAKLSIKSIENNYCEIDSILHQLKGTANTIGASLFGDAINKCELLRISHNYESYHYSVNGLINIHNLTIDSYRNYLAATKV